MTEPAIVLPVDPHDLHRAGAPWMKPWAWHITARGVTRLPVDATAASEGSVAVHPRLPVTAFVRDEDIYILDLRKPEAPKEVRVTSSARSYDDRYAGVYSTPIGWTPDAPRLVFRTKHNELEGHGITEGDGLEERAPYDVFPSRYGVFVFDLEDASIKQVGGATDQDAFIVPLHGDEVLWRDSVGTSNARIVGLSDAKVRAEVSLPAREWVAASVRPGVVVLSSTERVTVLELATSNLISQFSPSSPRPIRINGVAVSPSTRVALVATDDVRLSAAIQGRPWKEELWIDGARLLSTPAVCETPAWVDDHLLALLGCAREDVLPSLRVIDTRTGATVFEDRPQLELPNGADGLVEGRAGFAAYEHLDSAESLWLLIQCDPQAQCTVHAFTEDRDLGGRMEGRRDGRVITVGLSKPGPTGDLTVIQEISFEDAGKHIRVAERQLIPTRRTGSRSFHEVAFRGRLVDCDAMPICKTLRVSLAASPGTMKAN